METTKSLEGLVAKTTAKLQAKGYERFYADPTTPFADVFMSSYRFDDAWVLSVQIGNNDTDIEDDIDIEKASFDIDKTLSNDGQAKLWAQLLEWFEGTALCDAKLAAEQPIDSGSRKSAMPALKVASEVFEWFINDVGTAAGQALKDGSMTTTHPYIIIEVATDGKRAKINAFIDNKPAGSLDAIGTVNFLETNPDAVIYPSKACTGVENTMLYDNQASDTQKIRAHELHAAAINYSPIKHANWLKDLKLQLQDRFLWDSDGAYNYAGFETPPTGDSMPKINEW